jgi:hypothetical protein
MLEEYCCFLYLSYISNAQQEKCAENRAYKRRFAGGSDHKSAPI